MGDCNEILSSQEKTSGRVKDDRQMHEFWEALDVCGLVDMGYQGRWYTWFPRITFARDLTEVL